VAFINKSAIYLYLLGAFLMFKIYPPNAKITGQAGETNAKQ
jgi:hypothetical protein